MCDRIRKLLQELDTSESRIDRLSISIESLDRNLAITIEVGARAAFHQTPTPEESKDLKDLLETWLERERKNHTNISHTVRVIEDLLMEPQ